MNPQQPNGMPGQMPNQNGMSQNMSNQIGMRPNPMTQSQQQQPGPPQSGPGGPNPMNPAQNRPPMNQNFPQNNPMGGMQNNRFPPNQQQQQQMNVIIRIYLFRKLFNYFSISQRADHHPNHLQYHLMGLVLLRL